MNFNDYYVDICMQKGLRYKQDQQRTEDSPARFAAGKTG